MDPHVPTPHSVSESAQQITPPKFPAELLIDILSFSDSAFLWTVGRKVSRSFRQWSEEQYGKYHLYEKKIWARMKYFCWNRYRWVTDEFMFVFSHREAINSPGAVFVLKPKPEQTPGESQKKQWEENSHRLEFKVPWVVPHMAGDDLLKETNRSWCECHYRSYMDCCGHTNPKKRKDVCDSCFTTTFEREACDDHYSWKGARNAIEYKPENMTLEVQWKELENFRFFRTSEQDSLHSRFISSARVKA